MMMRTEFDSNERRERWDLSFLVDAKVAARRSKDPSTKVGAVAVRPDLTHASQGYNGFPRGVLDTEERLTNREIKYELVVHAETNALLTAKEPLVGYTLYCTFPPCVRCATSIIQAGIARVVSIKPTEEQEARWAFAKTRNLFAEVGIEMTEYEMDQVLLSAAGDGIAFIEWHNDRKLVSACSGAC